MLTHLLPEHQQQFEREGFTRNDNKVFQIFSDLDHGVEWCEEQILTAETELTTEKTHTDLVQYGGAFSESAFKHVMKYLEKQEVVKGHYLIHQGDPPDSLYFIESGQVEVQLDSGNGKPTYK